ncbi:hypothetical protein KFV02_00505 [Desulfohalobiaceae bacterium Ax17]|uniref:hypothetical protein n=1 Tax=Desulfovulcanus ferrireducens TaxID=2831190 RepID=UPI00207BBA8D|nr:hypothetical protein [Desulfovulcanus ferrireducens]MBT8762411.1 hypothetical protein [Desulfovulcanus ferrireducens]
MKEKMRLYGFINVQDPKKIDVLREIFTDFDLKIDENRIDFDLEEVFIDPEEYIEKLQEVLSDQDSGQIDFINFDEWQMTRYEIEGSKIHPRKIHLDGALEKYIYE